MKKKYIFISILIFLISLISIYLINYEDPKVRYSNEQENIAKNNELTLIDLNKGNIDLIYIYSQRIYVKSGKKVSRLPGAYKESSWEIREKFHIDNFRGSSFLSNSLPIGTKLYLSNENKNVIYVKNGDTFNAYEIYKK